MGMVFIRVRVYATDAFSVLRELELASDSLELELQLVVSCCVVLGTEPSPFGRTESAPSL